MCFTSANYAVQRLLQSGPHPYPFGAPNSSSQVNLACANEATGVINLLGIIIRAFRASALWSPELSVIVLAGWDQQEPLFNRRQLCEGPHTLICLLFRPCLSALRSQHPWTIPGSAALSTCLLGFLMNCVALSLSTPTVVESNRLTFETKARLEPSVNIFRGDYRIG